MHRMDLNSDVGEGWLEGRTEDEAALIQLVTSVNVACGVHAGDAATMQCAVEQAMAAQVQIGAHPGLPDRAGRGRRAMAIPPREVASLVREQLQALGDIVLASGARLQHVKLHGALYHLAAQEPSLAAAVVEAVVSHDAQLWIVGPPDSCLLREAHRAGLPHASEAFADRRYLSDGSLAPRDHPAALWANPVLAAEQALSIARDGLVHSTTGDCFPLQARTLCVHSDTPQAVAMARSIRNHLHRAGITLRRFAD